VEVKSGSGTKRLPFALAGIAVEVPLPRFGDEDGRDIWFAGAVLLFVESANSSADIRFPTLQNT